jgi:chemotaxis protein methyltransferase CheR
MIPITDKEFRQISEFLKDQCGIHLKNEKRTLVTGRLHQVLARHNLNSFSEYFDYVVKDRTGAAAAALIDRLTTNHTFFMREQEHFLFFRDQVLPYLIQTVRDKDMRIWSAACSTGEEPYTLAMILDEVLGKQKALWDSRILATDISNEVLDQAIRGIYSNDKLGPLPSHWKHQYFSKYNENESIIANHLRGQVIFRRYNLMDTGNPFRRKFHVIFCRNVMIYFDNRTKEELVDRFYDMMEYGGYLFIGQSESLNRDVTRFKYIQPSVYRKI